MGIDQSFHLEREKIVKRKANIQGTLAEGNEPISSLSFPNSGGKAVDGQALAPPRHSVFSQERAG